MMNVTPNETVTTSTTTTTTTITPVILQWDSLYFKTLSGRLKIAEMVRNRIFLVEFSGNIGNF